MEKNQSRKEEEDREDRTLDGRKEPMSKFFRVTLEQVKLFKTFWARRDRAQLRRKMRILIGFFFKVHFYAWSHSFGPFWPTTTRYFVGLPLCTSTCFLNKMMGVPKVYSYNRQNCAVLSNTARYPLVLSTLSLVKENRRIRQWKSAWIRWTSLTVFSVLPRKFIALSSSHLLQFKLQLGKGMKGKESIYKEK